MLQKIRRIVTGHNAANRATILFNDHAPNITPLKGWPGAGVTEIWVTGEMPIDNSGSPDRSLRPLRHDPTPSGTIFRVVEIPPESAGTKIDAASTFGQLGSTHKPSSEDFGQASDHAQDRFDRLFGRDLRLDDHGHGRRRGGIACRRLRRSARHQSRLGQPQRRALSFGSGADRRQACAVS